MIQINLIRDRKIAKVSGPKVAGPGFKLSLPRLPFNVGLILAALLLLASIVIPVLMWLTQTAQIASLQTKINNYNGELAKLAGPKRLVDETRQKQDDLRTKIGEIANIDQGRFYEVKLLDGLSQSMPDYLWLSRMTEDGSKITLDGFTFSNLIVADFMERLTASGHFTDVELQGTQKDLVSGREVVRFNLNAGIIPNPVDTETPAVAAAPTGKGRK